MIERKNVMPISYLKLEKFTGSFRGMRYRMEMTKKPADEAAGEEEKTLLLTTCWPEPYAFDATPEDQKVCAEFSFDEEGIETAVAWLNEEWKKRNEAYELEKRV